MANKHKSAMIIAFVAGILLLIAGVNGFTTWDTIRDFVIKNFFDHQFLQIIFSVLIFIASLGGIAVILGGYLIGKNKVRTGRLFILLGAGIGLIGFIISIIIGYFNGNYLFNTLFSLGGIGLILSILARMIAK